MNLFELADYAAFVAAGLVGLVVGRRMRPRPPTPPELTCSCTHGYGTHEDGGRCHGEVKGTPNHMDQWGNADGWEMRPCTCRRYDGPDPLAAGRSSFL